MRKLITRYGFKYCVIIIVNDGTEKTCISKT